MLRVPEDAPVLQRAVVKDLGRKMDSSGFLGRGRGRDHVI